MYVIYHPSDGRYISYADFKQYEMTHSLTRAVYFDSKEYAYAFIDHFMLDPFSFEVMYVEGVPYGNE